MEFWQGGFVQSLLIIVALLAVAGGLRRTIPPLRRLGMPDALLAGVLGMALGPGGVDVLPFQIESLESLVYHTLALVFIAVSLQSPPSGKRTGTALSIAFAIPAIAVLQGIIGLVGVLGWNAAAGELEVHPGFGMLVPLGFNQGPGPALTLGAAWEKDAGFKNGAQLGLIMAAAGYAWCCVVGVVLVAYGRWRGWHLTRGRLDTDEASEPHPPRKPPREAALGGLEPLTAQLVAIAIVYLATWGVLELLSPFIPEKFRATLWGFHFLIAIGLSMIARPIAKRLPEGALLDDDLLARISSTIVDVATCAALAAVRIEVIGEFWGPILLLSSAGGLATLIVCVWMARRALPSAPFEHMIVTYGTLTGTATTGFALLRMLDPQLEGPAARNYVRAMALSVLLGAPLFLLMPKPVLGFPETYPSAVLVSLAIFFAYLAAVVIAWRLFGPLRFTRPLWKLWPDTKSET